jgi:hypothetical protein
MERELPLEFDIAVRSRIAIAAPARTVWQWIEKPATWNPTIAGIERLAGEAGQVGETLRVMQRRGDQLVATILRTLSVEPAAWRVQSLETEASRAAQGYVLYSLQEDGAGTIVSGELVAHCVYPATATGEFSWETFAEQASAATRRKLDDDHARLKALVEQNL